MIEELTRKVRRPGGSRGGAAEVSLTLQRKASSFKSPKLRLANRISGTTRTAHKRSSSNAAASSPQSTRPINSNAMLRTPPSC